MYLFIFIHLFIHIFVHKQCKMTTYGTTLKGNITGLNAKSTCIAQ